MEIRVRLTFMDEVLGTASGNPDIHGEYIASKAPNPKSITEEIEAIGEEAVKEKGMTVFPRNKEGKPILWDYQVKGFFKDTCSALRKVKGSQSSKIKAFKKEIDGLIFINEREIPYEFNGETGECQRPLRANTAQGERVSIAHSETVPAGATVEFTINLLCDSHEQAVREWLDYGRLRGLGQWRNSGKGRFLWEELDEKEKVTGSNKQDKTTKQKKSSKKSLPETTEKPSS